MEEPNEILSSFLMHFILSFLFSCFLTLFYNINGILENF